MPVARKIKESIVASSMIRRMFEEGIALRKERGDDKVFDFTIGNPDLNPPEAFYQAAQQQVQDRTPGVHGYMPNAGYDFACAAMAKRCSREHAVDCSAANIVMTCGAAGGLNVVFKTILNPGEEVIVPVPFFAEYSFYIANQQGVMVTVATNDDFSLNVDAIRSAINEKTRAVLINTPNNPTGRIYDEASLNELCSLLQSYHEKGQTIYLVSDEPYREVIFDGAVVPPLLNRYSESFCVTSFSKTLSLPGERIGYIAQSPAMSDQGEVMNGLIMCNRILGYVNAPAFAQRVVASIFQERVNIEPYVKRRELFIKVLDDAGLQYCKPQGAFYFFIKSPCDDLVFVDQLKKFGILAVPGRGFGLKGYIRIAFCVPAEKIIASAPLWIEAVKTLQV